jgi:hypothetical protein
VREPIPVTGVRELEANTVLGATSHELRLHVETV